TLSRGELFHFTPELGFNASFTNLLVGVREHVPISSGRGTTSFIMGGGGQRRSSLNNNNNSSRNNSSFFVVSQVPELTRTLTRSSTAPMSTWNALPRIMDEA
ncbi:Ankyrin-like protein, partial [Globisporangium polare]